LCKTQKGIGTEIPKKKVNGEKNNKQGKLKGDLFGLWQKKRSETSVHNRDTEAG